MTAIIWPQPPNLSNMIPGLNEIILMGYTGGVYLDDSYTGRHLLDAPCICYRNPNNFSQLPGHLKPKYLICGIADIVFWFLPESTIYFPTHCNAYLWLLLTVKLNYNIWFGSCIQYPGISPFFASKKKLARTFFKKYEKAQKENSKLFILSFYVEKIKLLSFFRWLSGWWCCASVVVEEDGGPLFWCQFFFLFSISTSYRTKLSRKPNIFFFSFFLKKKLNLQFYSYNHIFPSVEIVFCFWATKVNFLTRKTYLPEYDVNIFKLKRIPTQKFPLKFPLKFPF